MEVIFADGGSRDTTLNIIEEFKTKFPDLRVKIVENRLKTGEAGKAAALKIATHEILVFIDSDNVLDSNDWLKKMVEPFGDKEIIAAEPIRYTYRKEDGYITRYCALMGMNDPLCYFLGNYDRECLLSGKWTQMPFKVKEDCVSYLKLYLDPRQLPTIGANGFFIRKSELDGLKIRDYLFDIDILAQILSENSNKCIAKVRVGIVHLFTGTLAGFCQKQKRRISDFRYFSRNKYRSYAWHKISRKGLLYFCFCCLFILPLIGQAFKGYLRKNDPCWLMHPIFCILTFGIYIFGVLLSQKTIERAQWQLPKTGF